MKYMVYVIFYIWDVGCYSYSSMLSCCVCVSGSHLSVRLHNQFIRGILHNLQPEVPPPPCQNRIRRLKSIKDEGGKSNQITELDFDIAKSLQQLLPREQIQVLCDTGSVNGKLSNPVPGWKVRLQ
jgi:hypothetical protein